MDNKDQVAPAPEASDVKAETPTSSGPARVTRRSFIAGGLAAVATLFGRKDASAATPPQNMVSGTENVRMEPGAQMAAGAENVRMEPGATMAGSVTDSQAKDFAASAERVQDKGSDVANSQLDVQATPQQNMVSGAENVRVEPGAKMADSTLDIRDKGSDMTQDQERVQKDFAGSAERVQEEGPNGGNDASVDSNGETPVEPVLPPQDEAKV